MKNGNSNGNGNSTSGTSGTNAKRHNTRITERRIYALFGTKSEADRVKRAARRTGKSPSKFVAEAAILQALAVVGAGSGRRA